MAHYRAEIQGMRGEASRLGTKSSGIYARAAGWDIGGNIDIRYDSETKRNVLTVSIDTGNSGKNRVKSFDFAVTREGVKQLS